MPSFSCSRQRLGKHSTAAVKIGPSSPCWMMQRSSCTSLPASSSGSHGGAARFQVSPVRALCRMSPSRENHWGACVVRLATSSRNVSARAASDIGQRAEHVLVLLRQQAAAFRHFLGVACVDLEPGAFRHGGERHRHAIWPALERQVDRSGWQHNNAASWQEQAACVERAHCSAARPRPRCVGGWAPPSLMRRVMAPSSGGSSAPGGSVCQAGSPRSVAELRDHIDNFIASYSGEAPAVRVEQEPCPPEAAQTMFRDLGDFLEY